MMEIFEKNKGVVLVILAALVLAAYVYRPVQHQVKGYYPEAALVASKAITPNSSGDETIAAINLANQGVVELKGVVNSHAKNFSYNNWWQTRLFAALVAALAVIAALVILVLALLRKLNELESKAEEVGRWEPVIKKLAKGKSVSEEEYRTAFGEPATPVAPVNTTQPGPTLAEQITGLKKLKDDGTLTQPQYDAAVAKLTGTATP